MINYAEKTTQELIDLLIQEEDRVTREHIDELVARSDALESLRAILRNPYYWDEAEYGEWWLLYHSFTGLAATRDLVVLPDLIAAYIKAHETDYDWIEELGFAAFAHFGPAAVEPLSQFVRAQRDAYRESWHYTYIRSRIVTALARIGLHHPEVRAAATNFVCELLNDPQETDETFTGLIIDDAVALDRERGLAAARAAYEREAVDEFVGGDSESFAEHLDLYPPAENWWYHRDLFQFYQPEEIAKRQARWQSEAEEEQRWAEQRALADASDADNSLPYPPFWEPQPLSAPAGYIKTEEGGFVREEKIGRNDPCPCLSGKKYKKCCGK